MNGPISVCELAQLFYNDMSDDDNKKKDAVMITEDTRVWSGDLGGSGDNNNNKKWNCLKDVDNLKKAIEAFWPISILNSVGVDNKTNKEEEDVSDDNIETTFDPSLMVYNDNKNQSSTMETEGNNNPELDEHATAKLEAFLSSAPGTEVKKAANDDKEYESDGETSYIKDRCASYWVPSNLYKPPVPRVNNDKHNKPSSSSLEKNANNTNNKNGNSTTTKKRKRKNLSSPPQTPGIGSISPTSL
ncbi:MAG: hypothetical protein GY874_07660 [Desulfobacteraceae bacterium]|nr:hypothetical protein [Desulfobacteraceae bacterium]